MGKRDPQAQERKKEITLKVLDVLKAFVSNPIISSVGAYALVHYAGQLKNASGDEYLISDVVLRVLKGLCAAYPVYHATRGGTAGSLAASGIATAVAVAAKRPALKSTWQSPVPREQTMSVRADPQVWEQFDYYKSYGMIPGAGG